MPTTPRKARQLLRERKARVVSRFPFCIQLQYPGGETCQPLTLGGDPGYTASGFSVRNLQTDREMFAAELLQRGDVSTNLDTRRMYRRNRRNRKWYRPPRFQNRARSPNWIPPSLTHKLASLLRFINRIGTFLPITHTVLERASFDPQKFLNPEIQGVEYQQGTLFGYQVREYLLEKWHRCCAYCGRTNIPLEVEHIIPKKPRKGESRGSDRVDNLTLACRPCNKAKGNLQPQAWARKLAKSSRPIDQTRAEGLAKVLTRCKKSLKSAPFMNLLRSRLILKVKASETWGYITKFQRLREGLPKSHVTDALVIAGGTKHTQRIQPFQVHQTRRNNRSLQTNRKGYKPGIRRQRYPLQPLDLVHSQKDGRLYSVKGVFNYGTWVRLRDTRTGQVVNCAIKNVQLVKYGKGFLFAPFPSASENTNRESA